MPIIGLFPLGIVLLPGERAALHIFESRYKDLIGKCLADDEDFGIALTDIAGLRNVATKASVVEVLERFEDGRINIIVEGNDRFGIVEVKDERTYLTAEFTDYLDEVPLPDEAEYEAALVDYRKVVAAAGLQLEEPVPDYRGLAFYIAAQIELPPEAKQELLEMRSESERLATVRKLLEAAAHAARQKMIERRASTNGHADPTK